jgi:pimeloyl-[acyl-carrier protein] methyl ester esterase
VTKLINIASSPKFVADTDWPGVPLSTLEKFSQLLIENYQKTLADFLELQLRGSTQQETLLKTLHQQFSDTPKTALPALLGGLKLLKETDLRPELYKITCPSLHIFGQNDVLIPAAIIPFIIQQIPHARCEIIKRAGHIPFLTHTESFLKLLTVDV